MSSCIGMTKLGFGLCEEDDVVIVVLIDENGGLEPYNINQYGKP